MTEQPTAGAAGTRPATQAQTLGAQNLANRIVRGVLRTPLLSRAAGSRLVTLYVTGRKSGRRYTIPVAYTRHDGDLLIGTPFGWGRNLRTGEPLTIRLKGRLRQADVQVFTTEADVTRWYRVMTRDNRTFAKFNKISYDAAGEPVPGDLHRAWADGARVFLLTPR
jgi:deazaflavin-dependent oxidoreductase (nitroreductase family)